MRDEWIHVGRLWTNGEQFLAIDSAARSDWRGDTDPIAVSVQVTTLVKDAFADLPGVYSLLSGVAHARPWGLADSASVAGRDASWRANPIEVTNSALICLLAAHRAAIMFAGYRGFPDDEGVQQMLRRHNALDRELVAFGRKNGYLAGMRPVDGFLAGT